MSKFGKKKNEVLEWLGQCVTDVLTTFWHLLWSITEWMHNNMESICFYKLYNKETKKKGVIDVICASILQQIITYSKTN